MMAKAQSKSFVWTDDEVSLLLKVTLDYKARKFQENVCWESCQSKYSDILEAFLQQYPSSEATGGREFPHDKDSISRPQVTSKLKAIRRKYRQAVDSGRRNRHGRVVMIFFELCEHIWGKSPPNVTCAIEAGIETADMLVNPEESSASTLCSTPASESSVDPRSSSEATAGCIPPTEVVKTRRDLQTKFNRHRADRLKRKIHADPAVEEDLRLKRRMLDLLEESERCNTERLDKITASIAAITNTIQEEFSLLKQFMRQPQPCVAYPQSNSDALLHDDTLQEEDIKPFICKTITY